MLQALKVSLFLTLIINFLLSSEALTVRGQRLQMNVTLELKSSTEGFDRAFHPIDQFYNDMKSVISEALKSSNQKVREYMDEKQYKYHALVYRFEKSAEDNKKKVLRAYDTLENNCESLVEEVDVESLRLEDVLKRRGCSVEMIADHLDYYFDKMQVSLAFEMNHLHRIMNVGDQVGNEAFHVQRNVISNLYDCSDSSDLECYKNSEALFDTHSDLIEATYAGFAQYQIESVENVEGFMKTRIQEEIHEASNSAWLTSCEDKPPTDPPDTTRNAETTRATTTPPESRRF